MLTLGSANAQFDKIKDPDEILIGNRKLPKVLLVGSWHFNYPGLDAHKSEENKRINIFSDRRQKELKELLDYIAQFKPTKIVVEGGRNSGYIMWRYRDWKSGEEPLGASETDQIAIRLLDRFGLDTIYGCDAMPLLIELHRNRDESKGETYADKLLDHHYFGGDDPLSKRYDALYEYEDRMTVEHTLLENFLYNNSDKVLDRGFGAYLGGGQFESEGFEGPDALSMFWFNRNLRIFHNIKNIGYDENDRIMVLFGAGHISILNYLFECSAEFELVKFGALDKLR